MSGSARAERRAFTADELTGGAALHVSLRRVLFQEIDAAGIVYFGRFFDYFHDAFIEWLNALGIDQARVLRERVWGAPLVHVEADYRAPLFFGDAVRVEVCAARVGGSSVQMGYRVRGPKGIHAVGQTVHAFVNLNELCAIPVPDDVRAAIGATVGATVAVR